MSILHTTEQERIVMADTLLTVAQVARRLQVNPETVRRWVRVGRLPARMLGGMKLGYRIRESDLDRFLETGWSSPREGRAAK